MSGAFSGQIISNRGVKQGCVLAPTPFNLFVNDLAPHLQCVEAPCPKLSSTQIPVLLYADMVCLEQELVWNIWFYVPMIIWHETGYNWILINLKF